MNKKIVIGLLLIASVIGISSCDLIGGIFAPAYVGTWSVEQTVGEAPDSNEAKKTLTLEKESWESITQIKDPNGVWMAIGATKGTLDVGGKTMTTVETHRKDPVIDLVANEITLPAEWTEVSGEDAMPENVTWNVVLDVLTLSGEDGELIAYKKVD